MISEKTIKICGKDVQVRYCLASETGFEVLSGKDASIFLPTPTGEKDENGKPIFNMPKPSTDDLLRLSIASILAAYECKGQEPPINVDDILYNATPDEVTTLIATTIELRMKWYRLADTVKPETTEQKEDDVKNA